MGTREASKHAIPLARVSFDEAEERNVLAALRSGWVGQGPRVAEFETRFARRVGAAEAVATSSCTGALFLALRSLGIGPGDEVIVPSLSFIASANAIVHCGAEPVFVDVDPRTYNIDPARIEEAVGPKTRAVMPIHQVGVPADLAAISDVASATGLQVIEDAACAVGVTYQGQPIGSSGNLACFSFHPRKVLTTGEGGMITTHDPELAARLRRLRHQGMTVSDLDRHHSASLIIEAYPEVGYNFRMSDIQAAVGLAQLDKLDSLVARRRECAARYGELLAPESRVVAPFIPAGTEPNFQSYLIRLRDCGAEDRNRVIEHLQQRGISTRRGLMAAHREAPHRRARRGDGLPHTELATDQTMCIPMHAELTADEQVMVAEQLSEALGAVLRRCG